MWLDTTLNKLNKLVCHEGQVLQHYNPRANIKHLDEIRGKVNKARSHVQYDSTVNRLLNSVKRWVLDIDLLDKMDQNPMLLGLENGVYDMQAKTFRTASKEDMISRSVGYAWLEAVDPLVEAEVDEFFAQLYPVEEERRMAQLWGGYNLLGYHPSKKFLMLTDARGGWNGKSTFIKALRATLGSDYSLQGTNAFLYKTDSNSETANSHTAGLLAHKGKRCVTYEELDAKRQLDCGLLKTYNGNRAKVQGRGCHATSTEEFEWTAKMTLAYNSGCMPGFDFTDEALISRMLVLHHRSRFCETQGQMQEELKSSPHTFMADPNLDDKLQRWRPYLLRFFLKGCELYHDEEFSKIPASCTTWKKELVKQHDTVKGFVDDSLECTGNDEDFIERSHLYEAYKMAYPEEKNKKTALGKRKWFDQLQTHLGSDGFFERKKKGGAFHRDIWIGWRVRDL